MQWISRALLIYLALASFLNFGECTFQNTERWGFAHYRSIPSSRRPETAFVKVPTNRDRTQVPRHLYPIDRTLRFKKVFGSSMKPFNFCHFRGTIPVRGGSVVLASSALGGTSAWLLPALACATSYALYNIFIKLAATADMDPILGGVILQLVAAAMGTILWLSTKFGFNVSGSAAATMTATGMFWSIAAGIAVGAAEILSFIVSGKGVPATKSIPIVVGGSILVGTILGSACLREYLTRRGWFGVFLITLGILIVGQDPGSTIGH